MVELDSQYVHKIYKIIGENIVNLRKSKKISQYALAFECGIDAPNLRKIEKGKVNPTVKTLLKIATALDVSINEFFKGI